MYRDSKRLQILLILLFTFSLNSFSMICTPHPGGSCTQVDGSETCKIEPGSYCNIGRQSSCSRVTNNGNVAIFMGAKDDTSDWDNFHGFPPQVVTLSGCTCLGGLQTWEVGGVSCSAVVPTMTHNQAPLTVNSVSSLGNGSATFTCSISTLSPPTGTTCTPAGPPQCPAQKLEWSEGTNDCEMNVGLTNDGVLVNASDTTGTTGTAGFNCVGTAWSAPITPDCNPVPPPGCSMGVEIVWFRNGNPLDMTCRADTPVSGIPNQILNLVAPYTGSGSDNHGSVQVRCIGSTWTITPFTSQCDCSRISNDPNEDCE